MYVFFVTIIANIFNVDLYKVSGRIYYVPAICTLIDWYFSENGIHGYKYVHANNVYCNHAISFRQLCSPLSTTANKRDDALIPSRWARFELIERENNRQFESLFENMRQNTLPCALISKADKAPKHHFQDEPSDLLGSRSKSLAGSVNQGN